MAIKRFQYKQTGVRYSFQMTPQQSHDLWARAARVLKFSTPSSLATKSYLNGIIDSLQLNNVISIELYETGVNIIFQQDPKSAIHCAYTLLAVKLVANKLRMAARPLEKGTHKKPKH